MQHYFIIIHFSVTILSLYLFFFIWEIKFVKQILIFLVRSLASISLRKSISDQTPFHFDYFTVSFAKDYSALYGGEFFIKNDENVNHCVKFETKIAKNCQYITYFYKRLLLIKVTSASICFCCNKFL